MAGWERGLSGSSVRNQSKCRRASSEWLGPRAQRHTGPRVRLVNELSKHWWFHRPSQGRSSCSKEHGKAAGTDALCFTHTKKGGGLGSAHRPALAQRPPLTSSIVLAFHQSR